MDSRIKTKFTGILWSMKFKKLLSTAIFLLIWIQVQAQERCATVPYNETLDQYFKGKYSIPQFEKWIKDKINEKKSKPQTYETMADEIYRIPVVIHVIHNGEQEGDGSNISDAQILSQIAVLNEDYRRLNADTINTPEIFKPVATDSYIEFKLAERDPNGEDTDGIVRVQGTKSEWVATNSSDNQELKSLSFWPPEDYLNIWVTTLANDYLGYAQYPITSLPGSIPPFDRETDGVVIHYRAFGSRDYGAFNLYSNYRYGRTTTHEVGHYLGLRHIWGDVVGCGGTDYCDDTPDAYESYNSCTNIDPVSCDSEDMYQNFLDYSYDRCMNIFTQDQTLRMRTVLENSPRRFSLLSSPGLKPEEDQNLLVIREIISPVNIECERIFEPIVSVQNNGLNDIYSYTVSIFLDATEYNISYAGDTIQSGQVRVLGISDQIGPIELSDGQYYFKAGIRNPNGIDTVDLTDYDLEKYFLIATNEEIAPFLETFEGSDIYPGLWSIYNPDNDKTWVIEDVPINLAENKAAVIRMYDYERFAAADWLVSPVLDLTEYSEANITFNYSYALGNETEDILDLKVSTDCGKTWPYTIFSASGDQLVTGSTDGPWMPTGSAEWKKGYADLGQFAGTEQIRIAFVTTNLNGNNLYLDNIEMYITGWTQDISLARNDMLIHPNPSDGSKFYITLRTGERQDVEMQIVDMNGKMVFAKEYTNVLNQTYEIDLVRERSGIYVVKAIKKVVTYVKKRPFIPSNAKTKNGNIRIIITNEMT